jgi:hypothetical protein
MGDNQMNQIQKLMSQSKWDIIIAKYLPKEICLNLNFSDTMHLIVDLAYENFQNGESQQFALKLILEAKEYFKQEWIRDWKNDVFLGDLCSYLCLYDQQYFYYKKAYEKLSDPPAALLLRLSSCDTTPDIPPITEQEAEYYLKKAAEKEITLETALALRTLSEKKHDQTQRNYWDQIYQKLEKEKIYADSLEPDVFKKNEKI